MQPPTIEGRLERLEGRVSEVDELRARLEALAERFESRLTPVDRPATAVHTTSIQVDPLLTRLDQVRDQLRQEIRVGDEDTRRFVRNLHEDVIRRLEALASDRQ